MERLRSHRLTVAAVTVQAAGRRFVFRCRFIRTMRRVVMGQASARRFLARKYLKAIRQRRAATRIQTMVRHEVARRSFLERKYASLLLQKVYRGYKGRQYFKDLYRKKKEQEKLDNSATVIQCLFRVIVARKAYEQVKLIERRPSKKAPHLEGKALKAAIQADKAAAVARQTAKDRAKEVDNLTTRLAGANDTAEKARLATDELKNVREELAAALAELEKMKAEAASSQRKVTELTQENDMLKEKLASGVFISGDPYSSKMYHDYPDIEELDRELYGMSARSKKNKEDLKALMSKLSILK